MKLHRWFWIILIILSITLPKQGHSWVTKVDATHAEIELLDAALYRLGTDLCRLPTTDEGLKILRARDGIVGWHGPYLNKQVPMDGWGHEYQYYFPPRYGSKKFDLYSFGADGKDDNGKGDDISNWKGYDRSYYKSSHWGYQEIIMLFLAIDFPAAIAIYLGIVFIRRRKRRKALPST